jgi:hypothetical protein
VLLDHAFVRLLGILNSILKHIAITRQEPGDLIKAGHAFTTEAIDQLTNFELVADYESLP